VEPAVTIALIVLGYFAVGLALAWLATYCHDDGYDFVPPIVFLWPLALPTLLLFLVCNEVCRIATGSENRTARELAVMAVEELEK
jgi:hypothetical protein